MSDVIRSMTGFAQSAGSSGATRWTWDIKTVNAKGLDVRLRVPAGFDGLEAAARRCIATRVTRGVCQVNLTVLRDTPVAEPRINIALLADLVRSLGSIALPPSIGPATLDGLLAIRGVVDVVDRVPAVDETAVLQAACQTGLDVALAGLVAMREREGEALRIVLSERLTTIAALTRRADDAPQRRPEAVMVRLAQAIASIVDRQGLDPHRLHQEAVLIAAKADVREELDRLATHVLAARNLMVGGGPVGRRLDFLAQELAREASTFCAKVNDAVLTAIGLELRVEIEQFREQVQNIE